MRSVILVLCVALLVMSCGSDELTLGEYAAEVESLTTELYQRLDELTIYADPGSEFPPVEDIQTTLSGLAAAYRGLLDGLQALEPPDEAAELHATSLEIVTELTTTQEAFAQRAQEVEAEHELGALFDSPEAAAAEAAQVEVIAFCQAAQAQMDATAEREAFADVPWMPSEVREVVLVTFGCESYEAGGG